MPKTKQIVGLVVIVLVLGGIGGYLAAPLFIDKEVNEPFSYPTPLEITRMSNDQRKDAMARAFAMAEAQPDVVMDEPMPITPTVLATGTFTDVDRLHQGTGTAIVYRLPDGKNIVRLDPFAVSNGPDLYLYLARNPVPTDGDSATEDFVSLGKLKGNKGSQNYPVPENVDVTRYGSVVVFCRLFGVLFSPATLEFVSE